jgi:outer membrane autotransporter protein
MNRTHRIIWSESRNAFIVASEGAKAKGKPSSTRKAIAAAVLAALGSLAAVPALAATSCPNTGGSTISISGAETSTCNLGAGDSLTVVANTGSINTGSSGVHVSSSTVGSITNNGTISGGNTGIYLATGGTTASSITNNGVISGNGWAGIYLANSTVTGSITNNAGGTISGRWGITLDTSSSVGSITNSGTISGNSAGIRIRSNSTVTSAISNSGTISGGSNGITLNSSSVGSITNSGTISSNTTSGDSGIRVDNGSTVGSITNSGGTIFGWQYGIYLNNSTITSSITNSGLITGATYDGIYANSSSVGSITNSGTISSGWTAGINLNYSTIGSITNSGLITADDTYCNCGTGIGININASNVGSITNSGTGTISGVNTGIRLSNSSTVTGGITNSGTISGGSYAIYVDNTSTLANLNITGTSARLIGDVLAQNTDVTVKAGATFANDNAFDVNKFIIENGATFNMGAGTNTSGMTNGITVANGFTNAGKLAVADGVTATITGDYTQTASGIFQTGASSSTSYGKLVVTGTATLAANTGIKVNVASVNTLAVGNTLSSVISAGTLSASTFTVTDNSALFDFSATVNGNAVDLLTNVASSSGSGVLDSVIATGFKPGRGAAVVLDSFVNGGTTGTDMDNVVTALGQLGSEKDVSNAVAQTLPLFTAGMNQVAINAMHGTNRIIQARQDSNHGMSSGDDFLGNSKFWLKPVGSWARQDNRNGVAGYDANTYGLVGGADGELNDSTRIGAALSWMHSNVDGNSTSSGNSADINAYQAILYGSHSLDAIPDTELNWQADLGTNKNTGRRVISFMNRVAKSDFDSLTAHVGVGLGRSYQLNDKTTITPAIRADYTWIRDEGYTESGAGALNLDVKGHSTDELILLAEGRLSHSLSDKATLVANLGAGYDVLNGRNSISSSYVGGGAAFTTKGLDASPWLARGGVGLAMNATESTEITARYDVEAREDYIDQTASVKVRWAF